MPERKKSLLVIGSPILRTLLEDVGREEQFGIERVDSYRSTGDWLSDKVSYYDCFLVCFQHSEVTIRCVSKIRKRFPLSLIIAVTLNEISEDKKVKSQLVRAGADNSFALPASIHRWRGFVEKILRIVERQKIEFL